MCVRMRARRWREERERGRERHTDSQRTSEEKKGNVQGQKRRGIQSQNLIFKIQLSRCRRLLQGGVIFFFAQTSTACLCASAAAAIAVCSSASLHPHTTTPTHTLRRVRTNAHVYSVLQPQAAPLENISKHLSKGHQNSSRRQFSLSLSLSLPLPLSVCLSVCPQTCSLTVHVYMCVFICLSVSETRAHTHPQTHAQPQTHEHPIPK